MKDRSSRYEAPVLMGGGVVRTSRTLEGNVDVVGVAGRTLIDPCGERAPGREFEFIAAETIEFEVDDVEDAFE